MSDDLFNFSGIHLRPDPSRTVIKPFSVEYPGPFRDKVPPGCVPWFSACCR